MHSGMDGLMHAWSKAWIVQISAVIALEDYSDNLFAQHVVNGPQVCKVFFAGKSLILAVKVMHTWYV